MQNGKSVTLTLGSRQQVLDDLVASGEYSSESEAVEAALGALERERVAFDEFMRVKVQEALDDPRPNIPASEVFATLRKRHEERLKASKSGS